MKTIITVLIVFCALTTHAQEWRKYHKNDFDLPYLLVRPDYLVSGRHFRINPYDNSLWMGNDFTIQTISNQGEVAYFNMTNDPVFQSTAEWVTFEFSANQVFALDESYGLFIYENDTWTNPYNPAEFSPGMSRDGDSLYILRENQSFIRWVNATIQPLYNSSTLKRILAKNNQFWMGYGLETPSLGFYSETGGFNWYNPDNTLIMDYGNYDFKFSPHHDTLYVAGNKGLSMLYNLAFFDSIAPDNTTNMPPGVILDFEFDANDNIWALFGSDVQTPTSIAHYNQITKNWDAYYDANNANLNFDTYCSIELDNLGNLWMVNQAYIHVLELSTLPAWLSVKQPKLEARVSIYPNPAKETVSIETDALLSEIYLTDQLGKRIRTFNPTEKQLSVAELPAGMYFVELVTEKGEKTTVKLVKE